MCKKLFDKNARPILGFSHRYMKNDEIVKSILSNGRFNSISI